MFLLTDMVNSLSFDVSPDSSLLGVFIYLYDIFRHIMEKQIQLPDTQSTKEALERVLAMQGYGLQDLKTTQQVRLVDVFFVAPVLLFASTKVEDKMLKLALYGLGWATLIYNGYNYLYYQNLLKNGSADKK